MTRAATRLVVAVALVLVAASGAWALWTATASDPAGGGARADELTAPSTPVATKDAPASTYVALSGFDTTELSHAGTPVPSYEVVRWDAPSGGTPVATFVCSPSACFEDNVDDGTWYYSVTGLWSDNWRSAESQRSDAVVIDSVAPQVLAINRAGTTPTADTTLVWDVEFSEDVVNVDAADFDVEAVGPTGATVTAVAGAGSVYSVTVDAGSGDGTLRLNLVDNGTIVDATVGNPLAGGSGPDGSFTGQAYTVDRTAPVVSVQRDGLEVTTATTVFWVLETSEPVVAAPDAADLSFTVTGAVDNPTVVGVQTLSSTEFVVEVALGGGDGTVDITVEAAAVTDLAGNPNVEVVADEPFTINRTAVVVEEFSRLDPSPTNASTVRWYLEFNHPVADVDLGDFNLLTTGTVTASKASVVADGDGYILTADSVDGNGTLQPELVDDDSIVSLLNGTTLNGPGTGDPVLGELYVVDTLDPSAVASVRAIPATASLINLSSVTFEAAFSEDVAGVTTSTFQPSLTGTGSGFSVSSVTPVTASTYAVVVATGAIDGQLRLDVVADPSVTDLTGNVLTTGFNSGESYLVDTIAPTVVYANRAGAELTNAATVTWDVVFSKPVGPVLATDFTTIGAAAPGTSVTSVSTVDSVTWQVSVSTAGDGALGLRVDDYDTIVDAAGNPLGGPGVGNGTFSGQTYTIDKTAPTVTLARVGAASTNNPVVSWTVTFSEPVSAPAVAGFVVTQTGLPSAVVTAVNTINPSTYVVTVNAGGGTGTVRLDILAAASYDAAGNPNAATSGDVVSIDTIAPVVTITSPAQGLVSAFTSITLSGTCTTGDGNVTVTITGPSAPTPSPVACNAGSWTTSALTFTSGSFSVVASQTDAAGNVGSSTARTFSVDTSAPRLVSIMRLNPTSEFTNLSTLQWQVTYSKPVVGLAVNRFSASGVPSLGVSSISGSGATYVVTASANNQNAQGTATLAMSGTVGITDEAGVAMTSTVPLGEVQTYTVDKTAPRFATATRLSPTNQTTNAATVTWTVTFSEAVTGVDVADFTVSGVTGASVTGVTGSGSTYTVTANTGTGNGTLSLALASGVSIADLAGNALVDLAPTGTVQTYIISKP